MLRRRSSDARPVLGPDHVSPTAAFLTTVPVSVAMGMDEGARGRSRSTGSQRA